VFDVITYAHIPRERREQNLETEVKKYEFIGTRTIWDYKPYNFITKKLNVSRDVILDEKDARNGRVEAKFQSNSCHK